MEPWEIIMLQAKLYNFFIDRNIYSNLSDISAELLSRCPLKNIDEMLDRYGLKIIISDEKCLAGNFIFSEICCADKEITLYNNSLNFLEMYFRELTGKNVDVSKMALTHEIAHYLDFCFCGLTENYFHSEVIADLFTKTFLSLDFYPGIAGLLFLHNKFIK